MKKFLLSLLFTIAVINVFSASMYFVKPNDWDRSVVCFMMGHDSYSHGYEMTIIPSTELYYYSMNPWGDYKNWAVFNTDALWGEEYNSIKNRKSWAPHSTEIGGKNLNNKCNLLLSNGTLTTGDSYTFLNHTQTIKLYVADTESAEGGTVSASSYKLTAANTASKSTGTTSVSAAYTATVTLTATPNAGHQFVGWYDGNKELSTNATYSYTADNADKTISAKFIELAPETPEITTFTASKQEVFVNEQVEFTVEVENADLKDVVLKCGEDVISNSWTPTIGGEYTITASLEGAATKQVVVTVYAATVSFDNTKSQWENVYAYCWTGDDKNAEWPGVKLTDPVDNKYTYNVTKAYENIQFNNGAAQKTIDLVFVDKKEYSLDKIVIYFDNTKAKFAEVYAYCWNTDDDKNADWPGVKLENPDNGVYAYESNIYYKNVIFNDNYTYQTEDLVFENGSTSEFEHKPVSLVGTISNWDNNDENNHMEFDGKKWVKTFPHKNLEVGIEYKVIFNHSWDNAIGDGSNNLTYFIEKAGDYDITFIYDPSTKKVSVEKTECVAPEVTLSEQTKYFIDDFTVTINCPNKDAETTVYYQIGEGEAVEYEEAISISETTTITAWSERHEKELAKVSATYTKVTRPAAPVLNVTEGKVVEGRFVETFEVTIPAVDGVEFYYTLNGGKETKYTEAIAIAETATLVAWAEQYGFESATRTEATYEKVARPAAPVLNVAEGNFVEAFEVTIANVDGVKFYYTLNAGEKTEYTAPISISETTTLVAWAEQYGFESATRTEATYTKVTRPAAPVLNVAEGKVVEGRFVEAFEVTIPVVDGVEFYYTLNGGEETKYTSAIAIEETTTLVAWAEQYGFESATRTEATYTKVTAPAAPIISREVNGNVFLTCVDNEGVDIYYVTIPTNVGEDIETVELATLLDDENLYTNPLSIWGTNTVITVYAVAVRYDIAYSEIVKHSYEFNASGNPVSAENVVMPEVYTIGGMVVVDGECEIFTITGQNVTAMNGSLSAGVYVVRTANAACKVVIK